MRYEAAKLLASTSPIILPVLDAEYRRVLDLGCGSGSTLLVLGLPADVLLFGVDVDLGALKELRQRTDRLQLACGKGEFLPFKDGCFDLVISKVAFPYMHIPTALKEASRVLREGGRLWMTLHPFKMAAMRILTDLVRLDLRDAVYQSYVVANGLALEFLGWQFWFPANRKRCESIQSVRGMAKALAREGFEGVQFEGRNRDNGTEADSKYGKLLVISARKRLRNPTEAANHA